MSNQTELRAAVQLAWEAHQKATRAAELTRSIWCGLMIQLEAANRQAAQVARPETGHSKLSAFGYVLDKPGKQIVTGNNFGNTEV